MRERAARVLLPELVAPVLVRERYALSCRTVALEGPGPDQGPVEGPEARQIGRRGRFQGLGVFAKGGEEDPATKDSWFLCILEPWSLPS